LSCNSSAHLAGFSSSEPAIAKQWNGKATVLASGSKKMNSQIYGKIILTFIAICMFVIVFKIHSYGEVGRFQMVFTEWEQLDKKIILRIDTKTGEVSRFLLYNPSGLPVTSTWQVFPTTVMRDTFYYKNATTTTPWMGESEFYKFRAEKTGESFWGP
jgi:hypothetical protein